MNSLFNMKFYNLPFIYSVCLNRSNNKWILGDDYDVYLFRSVLHSLLVHLLHKMFVFFILILMNWAMQVIYAQPSIKGSIINTKVIIPDVPRLELEDQDNDRLIRERDYPNDGVNNEPKIQFKRGPHRFGIHIPTKIDFFDIASAYISPDRTLITWRLTIYCRTAISLSCYFDNFFLGPGSELYIYGKEASFGIKYIY